MGYFKQINNRDHTEYEPSDIRIKKKLQTLSTQNRIKDITELLTIPSGLDEYSQVSYKYIAPYVSEDMTDANLKSITRGTTAEEQIEDFIDTFAHATYNIFGKFPYTGQSIPDNHSEYSPDDPEYILPILSFYESPDKTSARLPDFKYFTHYRNDPNFSDFLYTYADVDIIQSKIDCTLIFSESSKFIEDANYYKIIFNDLEISDDYTILYIKNETDEPIKIDSINNGAEFAALLYDLTENGIFAAPAKQGKKDDTLKILKEMSNSKVFKSMPVDKFFDFLTELDVDYENASTNIFTEHAEDKFRTTMLEKIKLHVEELKSCMTNQLDVPVDFHICLLDFNWRVVDRFYI